MTSCDIKYSGGKHNDVDAVGTDLHHHTFFEMMGNWAFNGSMKKVGYERSDAIKYVSQIAACKVAWVFLTEVVGISSDRLYVTYYGGSNDVSPDEECKEAWLELGRVIGDSQKTVTLESRRIAFSPMSARTSGKWRMSVLAGHARKYIMIGLEIDKRDIW